MPKSIICQSLLTALKKYFLLVKCNELGIIRYLLSIYKHEARVAYKFRNNTSSCVIANLFPVARVITLWLAVHIVTLQLVQYLYITVKILLYQQREAASFQPHQT